jgi:hypothetical protein
MYLPAGATIEPSREPAIVEPGLPRDRATAEAICEAVDLDRILLARQRGGRVAVQPYACGVGFGGTEFSDDLEIDGLVVASAGAAGDARAAGRLHDDAPWPVPADDVDPGPTRPPDGTTPPPKAWYRRAWVWVLIGGVVAGGVTTGAVLGTRASSGGIEVDAPSFEPQ